MKRKDVGTAFITHVDYPNKGRFTIEETGEQGIVKNTIPGDMTPYWGWAAEIETMEVR